VVHPQLQIKRKMI